MEWNMQQERGDARMKTANFGNEHLGDRVDTRTICCQADAKESAEEAQRYLECLKLAETGDVKAMAEVGRRLYDGIGVAMDRTAFFSWYLKAAEGGDVHSMHVVAHIYKSHAEYRNETKALEWYDRAAALGDEASIRDGAVLRATCRDLAPNPDGAREALRKLPPEEEADALYEIARHFRPPVRLRWLREAAESGHQRAMVDIALYYCHGSAARSPDFAAGAAWFRRAADRGMPEAMCHIGNLYYVGDGVPQDDEKAFSWYKKAADHGFHMALIQMGRMYYLGRGVPKDTKKAFNCFHKAAAEPETFPMMRRYNSLAHQYVGKILAESGEEEYIRWLSLAAEDDRNTEAIYEIADRYLHGKGIEKDPQKAVSYFEKAANNRNEPRGKDAVRRLVWIYKLGEGVAKDEIKAAFWQKRLRN